MKMNFELPAVGQWSLSDYYAANLRETMICGARGCVAAGTPRKILDSAGGQTLSVGNRLLTVGTDGRELSLDGTSVGRLGSRFLSALADGDRIMLFTEGGVEWLSGGGLQGAVPDDLQVTVAAGSVVERLQTEVVPPSKLSGVYTRLSDPLQPVDCVAMVGPVENAMAVLASRAAARGKLLGPAWVGWRMIDVDGRVVASAAPQRMGELPQSAGLTFSAALEGTTFSLSGSSTLAADAYGLTLSVGRSASTFWRRRVRSLEVIVWRDCYGVESTTGRFTAVDSSTARLSVAPRFVETAREGAGHVAARVDFPLEGVSMTLSLDDLGAVKGDDDASGSLLGDVRVGLVHGAGSVNVYALHGRQGEIGVASAADPLRLRVTARICRGEILRLCSPVGSGGGWNYGRHHLLAFATDGIFAVSIDGALTKVSSSLISGEGIARRDAVAVGVDGVMVATTSGNLLRICGSRVAAMASPVRAVALGRSEVFGETWLLDSEGGLTVMSDGGKVAARTMLAGERFDSEGLIVDSAGALRSLSEEDGGPTAVVWRRRVVDDDCAPLERRVEWTIDAARVNAMTLTLLGDGGGGAQRLVELAVNGAVNTPIAARFRAPRRNYLTAMLRGVVSPPARLVSVSVSSRRQCGRGYRR